MANKKGNTKKSANKNNQQGSALVPAIMALMFVALFAATFVLMDKINPIYTIVALAVSSYPVVVNFTRKLNKFVEAPNTFRVFIPFLNESGNFMSKGLEVTHNVMLILVLIGLVSAVGGNYVTFLSIPNAIGTLLYGDGVMNNSVVLSLYTYQVYFILACYAILCIVRGIAYCQIDNFIAQEDYRIYIMKSSRRNRTSAAVPQKHLAEYLYMATYFVPIVRALGIVTMQQRLNKLVVLNSMTINSKTSKSNVVVETDGDY